MIQFFDEIISSKVVMQWQRESRLKRVSNNKRRETGVSDYIWSEEVHRGRFWGLEIATGEGTKGGLKTPEGGGRGGVRVLE